MNTCRLTYVVISIVMTAGFFTLFYAFTISARAGLNRLVEKYEKARGTLTFWTPRWQLLQNTLLLCSMLCQAAAICLAVQYWQSLPSGMFTYRTVLLIVLAILTTVIFNLVPVALSERYADRLAILFIRPVGYITILLFPLAWTMSILKKGIDKVLTTGSSEDDSPSAEDAIMSIVEDPEDHSLTEPEREIIKSVLEFSEISAREIMTPRVNMVAIEDSTTVKEAVAMVRDSWHSRIPVFRETLDEIVGVVHVKDLLIPIFQGQRDRKVSELMVPPIFVTGAMPINIVFQRFLRQQIHLAIVLDEYGGTDGLVTMEDVIEELVGEIRDEYDNDESQHKILPDGSIVINGNMSVYDANELLDLDIPEDEDYESIAGLVLNRLARIPSPGETVTIPGMELTVREADARQIHTILLRRTATDTYEPEKD